MGQWEGNRAASDEWYTPPHVFEALGERFDTDVAHPGTSACHVPTDFWITQGALSCDWSSLGFIWMNPPFGGRNALDAWVGKFFDHGNGIALTPDRTSAPWFWKAWHRCDCVLFTRRIRFLRPDGTEGSVPANGTCIWASGERAETALKRAAAAGLGILGQPLLVQTA